jgi:hypothetical protein
MIDLPASVRVYLCPTPCDMRKSFDSLHALVREHLELDALAGSVANATRLNLARCSRLGRPSSEDAISRTT